MSELVDKVIASLPSKPATYEDNARASIAAVFDWQMARLAHAVQHTPDDALHERNGIRTAMWRLAEMRKAALGE